MAAAVDEMEFHDGRWSALAFQEGGRVGDGAADEVPPAAVAYPGPHGFVVRDERTQIGLVVHARLSEGLRAIEVSPRFVVVWIDAHPRGILLASLHAPDEWSADSEALAAFLMDLAADVERLLEKAPPSVEAALGGDWNVSVEDLSLGVEPRAVAMLGFMARLGLAVRGAGAIWRRPTDPASEGKELDYWLVRGDWGASVKEAMRALHIRSDDCPIRLRRAGRPSRAARFAPSAPTRRAGVLGWRPTQADLPRLQSALTASPGQRPTCCGLPDGAPERRGRC